MKPCGQFKLKSRANHFIKKPLFTKICFNFSVFLNQPANRLTSLKSFNLAPKTKCPFSIYHQFSFILLSLYSLFSLTTNKFFFSLIRSQLPSQLIESPHPCQLTRLRSSIQQIRVCTLSNQESAKLDSVLAGSST